MDVVTLSEELAQEGWLEKVGGVAYLAGLSEVVPFGTSANITEYSRIFKEKSTLRRLINISENIISRAQQEGGYSQRPAAGQHLAGQILARRGSTVLISLAPT